MNFYAKVSNGELVTYPQSELNLRMVLGSFDPANLPDGYLPVIKQARQRTSPYEVPAKKPTYLVDGEVVREVWISTPLSPFQKKALQDKVKADGGPYASWVFDEDTCSFVAPLDKPDHGNDYEWDEDAYQNDTNDPKTLGWTLVTEEGE